MLQARPYGEKLDEVLADVGVRAEPTRTTRCWLSATAALACIVLFTTDRGLCGSLNTNTIRFASSRDRGARR